MDQSSCDPDEDQDSLFGSPPPSPARGRSPSQETLVAVGARPITATPSTEVSRKNVGTIALPGSHMSCAELPANLPASSLSFPRPTSSHDSSGVATPNIDGAPISVHTPVVTSRSPTCSISSRVSSAAGTIPSASASSRKRRTPKSKSLTPIPPSITLPGPNEPTPPNFLRSQSSLLGLAGLVGCVKPAQLYTHDPQPSPVQQPLSHSPIRGSTPAYPIVIEDDRDIPHIGKHPISQLQIPQHLDQLDPELFRSNMVNSLTKEKNLFPVLESLIKLLGGDPHPRSVNPIPQPFARPYGHGIFNAQFSSPMPSHSAPGGPMTATAPPQKRRKLKHVPAGAADWDVPFPFAAGEGPETYRDTWARDRAKYLVTQLLELLQSATKRAAIKTAKSKEKTSKGRASSRDSQTSRSGSVETQIGQISSVQENTLGSSLHTNSSTQAAMTGMPTNSSLRASGAVGSPTSGSRDRMSVDSDGGVEEGNLAVPYYSAFEEWLSQLQLFLPPETDAPTPEPGRDTGPLACLVSSASSPPPEVLAPLQNATRDGAIDPALLAISELFGSAPQSQPPTRQTSTVTVGGIPQALDVSPTPPILAHSPRTSLSPLTEPLTPLLEAFSDAASTIVHSDAVRDHPTLQPVEKEYASRPAKRIQPMTQSSCPTEPPRTAAAQKGKTRADGSVTSVLSASNQSTPSSTSASKGPLNKQGILERARERRRQLVAEIERAKMEIWETTIENAVLVHFTRDRSS